MEQDFEAIALSGLVEGCESASVRDHNWHSHLQEAAPMAIVVRQLDASQFRVDSCSNNCRVFLPASPLLSSEPISTVLDRGRGDSILSLELLGNVVLASILKDSLITVPASPDLIS